MFALDIDDSTKGHTIAGGARAYRLPLADFCARFEASVLYEARLYITRAEGAPEGRYCEFTYQPADPGADPPFEGSLFVLLPRGEELGPLGDARVTLAVGRRADATRLARERSETSAAG